MKVCEKCGKQFNTELTRCLYCGHMNKEEIEKKKAIKREVNVNKTLENKETSKESKSLEVNEVSNGNQNTNNDTNDLNILLTENVKIKKNGLNLDRTTVIIGILSLTAIAFAGGTYYMYSQNEKSKVTITENLELQNSLIDELINTENSLEEANNQIELLKNENDKLTLKLDSLISGVGEEGRSVYDFGSIYYIKNKEFDNVYPMHIQGEVVVVEMNNYFFSLLDDDTLEYMIRFHLSEYKKILNSINNTLSKIETMDEINQEIKNIVENKEIYKSEYGNTMSLVELDKFTRGLVGNATTREFKYIKTYVDEYNNLSKWKNTITNPVSEIDVFKMNIDDLKKNVDKNGYSEMLSKSPESFKPVVPSSEIEKILEGTSCDNILNYINEEKITVDVVESSLYVCMLAYQDYLNNLASIVKNDKLDIKYMESLGNPLKADGLPKGISFLELKDIIEWLLTSGKKAGYRLYGFSDMKKTLDEMHINVLTRPTTYTQNGKLKDNIVNDIPNVNTQTYKLLDGKEESIFNLITEIDSMYSSYKSNLAQMQSNNQ